MFFRLRIRPRMLRNVSGRNTGCRVMGCELSAPIGVSPTAMQKMAHPDGEVANARAVGKFGSIFTLSTLSTSSIEEVAAAAPDTIKWFQLYVYKQRDITRDFLTRVEKAGFKAIVLTIDTAAFGKRYADVRNQFKLPPSLKLANFEGNYSTAVNQSNSKSALANISELLDDSLNWDDVKWLMRSTRLPIVLKGVLTGEDAAMGAELGVSGIIVSNHGARQLDTVPATIEALREVVRAVKGRCEVYLDGGVTYGTDVFKALALGARMVFVGRPAIWGLTAGGEGGVKHVLDILADEFNTTLALAGKSFDPLIPVSFYFWYTTKR
ncbi:hypothetical protein AAG570_000017 [Ranatra chinensis]|uniref:(S)-2-hydroxy-acid oxidase n=1 Tax=Ranatra chinensis TaxID=642074 RepID=A0ABD0YVV8_9HEMI